ncbi:MAG: hypothetical protein HYZ26_14045 [Chloroflexi bacterium]|nr:hypothetical protein [Chloroflexota bacterium]
MLARFSTALRRYATGRNVSAFFVLDALFMFGVMPAAGAWLGAQPLDLRFYYTASEAIDALAAYGPAVRESYRMVQLTLDLLYPVTYTLFFCLLITWLFQKGLPVASRLHGFNVVPLGGFAFDLLENFSIVALLSSYPDVSRALAAAAGVFTLLKWLLAGASLALVLTGLIGWLRKRGS